MEKEDNKICKRLVILAAVCDLRADGGERCSPPRPASFPPLINPSAACPPPAYDCLLAWCAPPLSPLFSSSSLCHIPLSSFYPPPSLLSSLPPSTSALTYLPCIVPPFHFQRKMRFYFTHALAHT